jgi:SAM-dependent methyltransferase
VRPEPDPAKAKRLVAAGYDRIAERYAAWTGAVRDPERERYTELLLTALPAGARVLELGCGHGLPTTRRLAERFAVTGVDLSPRQVGFARQNVPAATIIEADMTAVDVPAASFDAVTAFYSLTHVPRAEQPALLRRVAGWLRPGGLFVASLGGGDSPDVVEEDWLGAPMYFSHYDAETNRRLVREAGFEIASAIVHTAEEDGVPVPFLWVVARTPIHPWPASPPSARARRS